MTQLAEQHANDARPFALRTSVRPPVQLLSFMGITLSASSFGIECSLAARPLRICACDNDNILAIIMIIVKINPDTFNKAAQMTSAA